MKSYIHPLAVVPLAMALFLVGSPPRANAAQNAKAGAVQGTAGTNTVAQQEIPKSVFVIPSSPKEGCNPFFPYETKQPTPIPTPKTGGAVDLGGLVLNGITSPPKRSAMINGRTFEPGESGEVRLPNGTRILLKCEEIRDDSAIILIDGQRRELRLRFGA